MAPGYKAHRAAMHRSIGKSQPRRCDVVRLESPVIGILMIADDFLIAWFFDEPVGRPQQDIGAKNLGNRYNDSWIVDHRPSPILNQVEVGSNACGFFCATKVIFKLLEVPPQGSALAITKYFDRTDESVSVIVSDLTFCELVLQKRSASR